MLLFQFRHLFGGLPQLVVGGMVGTASGGHPLLHLLLNSLLNDRHHLIQVIGERPEGEITRGNGMFFVEQRGLQPGSQRLPEVFAH